MFITTPLTEADVPEAVEVLTISLGEDFISSSDLLSIIKNEFGAGYKTVDTANNKIVGVITGVQIHNQDELNHYLNGFEEKFLNSLIDSDIFPTMIIESVAVLKDYSGLGIGTSLAEELIAWGASNKAKFIFSVAWADENGCHIEKVFTRLGLRQVIEIDSFWFIDSIEREYSCPSCGNPCFCSAILFGKLIV